MRTQYVIFDNNYYSMRALHAVLSYAETAKQCGYADIKVVIPPILLSEINRGILARDRQLSRDNNGHENGHTANGIYPESTNGNGRYNGHYGHKNGHTPSYRYSDAHEGSYVNGSGNGQSGRARVYNGRPKRENIYEDLTLRDVLEAYNDYVIYPPLSRTEERIQDLMYDHLVDLHQRRQTLFYRQTRLKPGSIVNAAEEMMEKLKDPAFFCQMFEVCTSNGVFRNQLKTLGLDRDPADTAIVAWFAKNCETEPQSDTILISGDQKLIDQMTAIHNFQFSPKKPERDPLAHFEYFDLPSLGTHLQDEIKQLETFAREKNEMSDTLRMHISSTQDMAETIARRNRSNSRFINDSILSSRLK